MEVEASKFATQDVISSMPDIVVTHILDRLPVRDAVMTGILSKDWRFKWTMLSELVFDFKFFMGLSRKGGQKGFGRFISRLLLHLKGAITKFVLKIDEQFYSELDDGDIAHWILFLSRKGVKDLTIMKTNGAPLKLPTHFFSCLELEHLKLFYCQFEPPASFNGFPNLLSLELDLLYFQNSKFEGFIIQCPLLEILKMHLQILYRHVLSRHDQFNYETMNLGIVRVGKVNVVEIAKLANLKILCLALRNTVMIRNSSGILELVGFLPKLQDLDLDFEGWKFTEADAKRRFLTTFPCLKTLTLSRINLCNGIMLSCALELIGSFPNLQTLEIRTGDSNDGPTPAICSSDIDYNTMGVLQLQSAVCHGFKDSENEVSLIKCLLACSPFLKRIVIHPHRCLSSDEKLMFAMKLLKVHRASPIAEIDLCCLSRRARVKLKVEKYLG